VASTRPGPRQLNQNRAQKPLVSGNNTIIIITTIIVIITIIIIKIIIILTYDI
jgi:hypothetical protein